MEMEESEGRDREQKDKKEQRPAPPIAPPPAKKVQRAATTSPNAGDGQQAYTWWISRSHLLNPEERTGWRLAWILEEFSKEPLISQACKWPTFQERVQSLGLESLLTDNVTPRKACKLLQAAGAEGVKILDESGQRAMAQSIAKSIPSYISGLRCWATYLDALGVKTHFPATETQVMRYMVLFRRLVTLQQYLKHLKCAHRFLRLPVHWNTASVQQALRGVAKTKAKAPDRSALSTSQVKSIVNEAIKAEDYEMVTMVTVGRLFLLRIPSECVPMRWKGAHSAMEVDEQRAILTLTKRKNSQFPVKLVRDCCCKTTGRKMCAVHWLMEWKTKAEDKLFTMDAKVFTEKLRSYAVAAGVKTDTPIIAHALRRGMAQDVLDSSGSLAVLLRSGDWNSSAFKHYLRAQQPEEVAISRAVINLSDSEDEE